MDDEKMMTQDIAQLHGAEYAEDVIQALCDGCKKANFDMDFERGFCDIQAAYGVDGEHPKIVCHEHPFKAWCVDWEGEDA